MMSSMRGIWVRILVSDVVQFPVVLVLPSFLFTNTIGDVTRDWQTALTSSSHLLNRCCSFFSFCQRESPYWLPDRWCFSSVNLVLYEVRASKVMWTCRKDMRIHSTICVVLDTQSVTERSYSSFK